ISTAFMNCAMRSRRKVTVPRAALAWGYHSMVRRERGQIWTGERRSFSGALRGLGETARMNRKATVGNGRGQCGRRSEHAGRVVAAEGARRYGQRRSRLVVLCKSAFRNGTPGGRHLVPP